MEFLVRLEDKVNTQVFCMNPVHKGNHMDRVFYEDATFRAPCPECGSDKFLYRKNSAITKKGHFITYKPDNWTWGVNERKHYGIVKIDCTEKEAKVWCEGIRDEQAETDANNYRSQADNRKQAIIKSLPIPLMKEIVKNALESDVQYQDLRWQERQSENKATIVYRPRKNKFDFEKVLTETQFADWNNKKKYSPVVSISDKTEIKEAI